MSDVRKMISGSLKNIERKLVSDHGVHLLLPPPSPLSAGWDGGGGLSLLPNFQKGSLTGSQFLEGVDRVTFSWGEGWCCSFYIICKLNSEIFNDINAYKRKCFSLL